MVESTPGHELPLRLFAAFRAAVDEVHAELTRRGHPDVRPTHGFVFQAIGTEGTTAVALAARLGVTKQAAGKTIAALERQGYLERAADPRDARRKLVRLPGRGVAVLQPSAQVFAQVQARWAEAIGAARLAELHDDLRTVAPGEPFRLDAPGWFGADR